MKCFSSSLKTLGTIFVKNVLISKSSVKIIISWSKFSCFIYLAVYEISVVVIPFPHFRKLDHQIFRHLSSFPFFSSLQIHTLLLAFPGITFHSHFFFINLYFVTYIQNIISISRNIFNEIHFRCFLHKFFLKIILTYRNEDTSVQKISSISSRA